MRCTYGSAADAGSGVGLGVLACALWCSDATLPFMCEPSFCAMAAPLPPVAACSDAPGMVFGTLKGADGLPVLWPGGAFVVCAVDAGLEAFGVAASGMSGLMDAGRTPAIARARARFSETLLSGLLALVPE